MKILKTIEVQISNQYFWHKHLILITLLFALFSTATFAQQGSSFGVKGGLNYNANGNYFESVGENAKHPDRNIGYHIGIFGKIGNRIYFKPEVIYTNTQSDYNGITLKMQKLDAPLLIGLKVLGPVSVFGGPSIQYIINSKFDTITVENIKQDYSIGLNFGIALNMKEFGIDLRYERGFNKNEGNFINTNLGGNTSRIDTRPDQLILSLSIKL